MQRHEGYCFPYISVWVCEDNLTTELEVTDHRHAEGQVCGTAGAVVHHMQVAVVGRPQPNIPVTADTDGLYRMLSIQKTRVL